MMKCRLVFSLLIGVFAIVALNGCVAKSEFDSCVRRNDTLQERINRLEAEQGGWAQKYDKYLSENEVLRTLIEAAQKKVDLLTENSLSNPYFIESIEETKELLYAA